MNAADRIVSAALAVLSAAPAITTGPIAEDLDSAAFGEDITEAVSVNLVATDPQAEAQILGHPVDWISTIVIECYARRDNAAVGGARASRALHAKAYARLMAAPTLAGAADDVREPSISTDSARRDTRLGCTTGTYPIWHRTAARTLEV